MPVIPQFDPAQAPSVSSDLSLKSQNDAQSWMTQNEERQNIQARTQQAQAQTAQLQAQLPAIVATAHANAVAANAAVNQAAIVQLARANANKNAPDATNEYMGIMGTAADDEANASFHPADEVDDQGNVTPNWQAQHDALAAWQSKYSYLALVPEQKALWQQVETAKQNAWTMNMKNNAAQIHMNQQQAVLDNQVAVQTLRNAGNQAVAGTRAAATTGAATIRSDASTAAANTRAQATQNSAAIRAYAETAKSLRTAAANNPDPDQKDQLNKQAEGFELLQKALSGKPVSVQEAALLPAGTHFVGVDGKARTAIGASPAAAPSPASEEAAEPQQ